MGDIKGKRLLELGCGAGEASVQKIEKCIYKKMTINEYSII